MSKLPSGPPNRNLVPIRERALRNSPLNQSQAGEAKTSLEELKSKSSSNTQPSLFDSPLSGTLNDESMVRSAVTSSIKRCGKSREQIADEMSDLLGIQVTARMITAFTAESKELHRFPGSWDRAFCQATSDNRLLICRVEAAGLRVITAEEEKLLDLGREYLRRKRAEKKIASLESDFEGVDL